MNLAHHELHQQLSISYIILKSIKKLSFLRQSDLIRKTYKAVLT